MATVVWHTSMLLLTLILVCGDAEHEFRSYYDTFPEEPSYITDEEYIRHLHSMYNAYKGDFGGRLVETNALVDTKYRMWKRNVDLINSILSMPKGLNEAGR